MSREFSIVEWYPDLEQHRCGYCKQIDKSCTYGMLANRLTVEDYQNLIDRGWRRSGTYCYKPVMEITCCPLYTIRCAALNLKISKSQKKIIKRVNRFLSESFQDKSNEDVEMCQSETISDFVSVEKTVRKIDIDKIQTNLTDSCIENVSENSELVSVIDNDVNITEPSTSNNSNVRNVKPGTGVNTSKPPCKKAKLLRLERRRLKLAAKGIVATENVNINQAKTLEQLINEISENPIHKLRVSLVYTGPGSKHRERAIAQEFPVYRKYQIIVHEDPPEKCTERSFTKFLFSSPLQKLSSIMYNGTRNRIPSVISEYWNPSNGPPSGYGSFHQQYWLDEKLIAVGVIDILPKCVSSVYFFYDPDYRHLTLGTYGSLRELYFTREINKVAPNIIYYYMGYYIHSCPKMRYKANLSPSYLLCPETYIWFPVEQCLPKLSKNPYSRFNEDENAIDNNKCTQADIDQLLVMISITHYTRFQNLKNEPTICVEEYKRFADLIGKKCIKNMLMLSKDIQF